jgi:hypothetical protein
MSSPVLALTPAPIITGTGAGAATGTAPPTATVLTHHVRTRLENSRAGIWAASRALHGPGAPCFPLFSHHPCRLPASGAGRA